MTVPPDRPPSGFPPFFAVLLPFLVAAGLGLASLRGTFIRDDWDYFAGNPHVVCPVSLSEAFKSPFQPLQSLGLYRPVTTLSLRLDAWISSDVLGLGDYRTEVFHGTNALLAGIAAALVALLARNLVTRRAGAEAAGRAALVAGLVFAAHPARTEAVCWVSGRAENLMAVFSLLCLVLATGRESLVRSVLAALCAVAAALSKEQGFALALVLPFVSPPASGKRFVQWVLVSGALALAFILRWGVLKGVMLIPGMPVFEDLSVPERVVQGFRLLFEYARATVWPHPLLFEYDARLLRANGPADPKAIAGLAVLGFVVAALARPRTRPLPAWAAAIWFFPLVPVLNVFIPIGEDFAERFLALPVAGLALLFGALAARFPSAGFGAGMLAVAAGGALFVARAADYQSERALYEAQFARTPDNPAAKSLLASTLLLPDGGTRFPDPREAARAETLLREAVAAAPAYGPARILLASHEAQKRAARRALPLPADLDLLLDTARRFPNLSRVHGMLGVALFERRAHDLARTELERELAIMPLDSTAAEHLARIQEAAGDKTGARKTIADLQSGWEALWRRFPGYAPVAITYSRTLSEQARDLDRARAVLRESAAAACRASDRTRIELALAEIGGR